VVPEAPLERVGNGVRPSGEGWFVANARNVPWFESAGAGPCLILGVGARRKGRGIRYPVNELALKYGAGVEKETTEPREAYARFGEDKPVACPPEFPE
jgi:hypothetical protein